MNEKILDNDMLQHEFVFGELLTLFTSMLRWLLIMIVVFSLYNIVLLINNAFAMQSYFKMFQQSHTLGAMNIAYLAFRMISLLLAVFSIANLLMLYYQGNNFVKNRNIAILKSYFRISRTGLIISVLSTFFSMVITILVTLQYTPYKLD